MALGIQQENRGEQERLLEIPVRLAVGEHAHSLRALLDSGAQDDFISQHTVVRLELPLVSAPLRARAVDGHSVDVYGRLACEVHATDSQGRSESTARHLISTEIQGYDLILGKKWLREVNPLINWKDDEWEYRPLEKRINMCTLIEELDVQEGELIYLAYYKPAQTMREGSAFLASISMEEVVIPSYLSDFADVFAEPEKEVLPNETKVEHSIPLVENATVPYGPIYPLSGKELEALRVYLDEALAKGWIQPSESPAGAPILFVPKKDGSLRLCVDYRGLNKVTIKNRYPLPLILEILDRLNGAKYFTKLDLRDAYHRIRILRGDRWKTAFRTRYGQFEYLVMPFGLTNAPATFQAYINEALKGLLDDFCIAYMDDILIYSDSYEEHVRHVREVLERLREFSLYAKLSKCEFETQEVDFLGFRIGLAGVSMDPSKVAAIEEWPEPETYRDVQCFLGFANFYRGFIRNYSRIVAPLTNLFVGMKAGKKTGSLDWNADAQQAFRSLKNKFQEAPLLKHYDPMKECRVETDASGVAVGGVLSQPYEAHGDSRRVAWHPVAFFSKKMSPAEQRYATGDQEMLAIVRAFKEWRHYLEAPAKCTRVLTDHEALLRFMDDKVLSRKRQTRWAEMLAAYDFKIEWRKGKENPADGLSRRPDHMAGAIPPEGGRVQDLVAARMHGAADSQASREVNTVWLAAVTRAQTMKKHLPKDSEWNTITNPALVVRKKHEKPKQKATNEGNGSIERSNTTEESTKTTLSAGEELARQLRDLQSRDAFCSEQKWNMYPEGRITNAPYKGIWNVDPAGLVRCDGAVYVPEDQAIRQEIIRVNHDDPWQGGHFGRGRTLEVIQRCYWWPHMRRMVEAYVSTCDVCQRMKVPRHAPYGLLETLPQPEGPWQDISMDFITSFPPAKHRRGVCDSILVIVCRFSKMVRFIPCTKDIDAPELANLICEEIIAKYGVPKSIVSDRSSLFTSKYWSTFCYSLAIRRRLSTAFHPQTDGQTERTNQTLECYLRCYINYEQSDWPMLLASAEYACNNARSLTTKKTPFGIVFTFTPTTLQNINPERSSENKSSKEKAEQIIEAQRELNAAWEHAQRSVIASYNKHRKEIQFQPGDKVLLASKNIQLHRINRKLADKYLGPFTIEKRIGKNAYLLKLPPKYGRLHPVFHVSLLQAYHLREGCDPPEPLDIDGGEEWEVEKILRTEGKGKKKRFLVRWKGWSEAHDSWEPVSHLKNAKERIKEFEESRDSHSTG